MVEARVHLISCTVVSGIYSEESAEARARISLPDSLEERNAMTSP